MKLGKCPACGSTALMSSKVATDPDPEVRARVPMHRAILSCDQCPWLAYGWVSNHYLSPDKKIKDQAKWVLRGPN